MQTQNSIYHLYLHSRLQDEKRLKMDQSSASDESYYAADSVVERESSKIDILPNRWVVLFQESECMESAVVQCTHTVIHQGFFVI